MGAGEKAHQYVVFEPAILLGSGRPNELRVHEIEDPVWHELLGTGLSRDDYTIDSLPLVKFHSDKFDPPVQPTYVQDVFSVQSPSANAGENFRKAIYASTRNGSKAWRAIAVNPVTTMAEYSVPVAPDATMFGTLDGARRLIRADQLPESLNGDSVNVIVIDAGIDKSMVPRGQFGGGWQPLPQNPSLPTPPPPGATTGEDALHGMMIVNNILAMAPRARIFDVPLIPPPKIYDIFSFLVAADAVYNQILHDILWFRSLENDPFPGPWVFMNAWAIFDRRSEGKYLGEYTENLGPCGKPPHYFIHRIECVARENFDIVFCAGNCGEVCPDDRCGPNDYGPGRGIWGANAHRDVLTVGAVRVDALWPGYSSEGPGPTPNLYAQKPDICAPSQFLGAGGVYPPKRRSRNQ